MMELAQELQYICREKPVEVRCVKCHKRHFDAIKPATKTDTIIIWVCQKCKHKNTISL